MPDVSIVIPLRDEEPNIRPLIDELGAVLDPLSISYEVILVDDGSTDRTFEELVAVQQRDARLKIVRLAKNYGQTAAFAAGFAQARGAVIVTSDGDLQNDPNDIPRMLDLVRSHDIVCGWRRDRKDNFFTRYLPSVAANWLIGLVGGLPLHDNGCSLKVFRAEVVKPLKLRPGMHRYLPVIASQLGPRVTEVVVNHRPRRYGRSKYGLSRTFTVVADLVRLRELMRSAVDPQAPTPAIYRIAEIRERDARQPPDFAGTRI
jgi:glycosyltransferase involved in cell wall biosynthesis